MNPQVVAHDLHPEYLSTKYAATCENVSLVAVQHHHAHIASCLADNGEDGPVIGVAFDGTGYGTDGTIWGGEFLVADLAEFSRAAFLAPVPLPGGAAAIRQPWRMAAAYLSAAYPEGPPDSLDVMRRNAGRWDDVLAVARSGINSPLTSSAGRLFDAVAAVLGVRDSINYEGQAAIELEQLADPGRDLGGYPVTIEEGEQLRVVGADLIRAVAEDVRCGVAGPIVAARFHHGVADAIARTCAILRSRTGLGVVALSGGVFQNLLLLDRTVGRLEADGFRVLVHARVPPNDGGISLGQAAVAAARDRLLLGVLVRRFQEFPGHYPHGYVTRLERGRRDGRRIDLDKGGKLGLGPDDLSPLAEPAPDSDHVRPTTRRGRFTRSPAHCSRGFLHYFARPA